MVKSFSELVAVVTGGSRGYGAGIAESLKNRGAEVWITGRDDGALKDMAKRLGVRAVRADVTVSDDWDRLFDDILKAAGRLDILVNNAGAGIRIAPVVEQTDDEISRSISVNLTGAILGCRRAAPVMKKQKSGTIVNISSICATEAWPGWAVYSAAKAGMVQFSKCLYAELREAGVRVTNVIPSWGATQFSQSAGIPQLDEEHQRLAIQPGDIGELVANICLLPSHLEVLDMTILPMIQEIVPL
ncbi:MAG: SDR family oxidoreductase [Planctomycetota bacterium]|nr:SDR family oxidoreductase [Planctomycetota bacterium]